MTMPPQPPPGSPLGPRPAPPERSLATVGQLAALEEKFGRWLRALEVEQFHITGELSHVRDAADRANNGLDTLEDSLLEVTDKLSGLAEQTQFDGVAQPVAIPPAQPAPPTTAAQPERPAEDGDGVERPSLDKLYGWVEEQIAPMVRKTTTTGEGGGIRWCRQWWLHHDAVERFTALYLAHTELSESDEATWLSAYLRDHLDPHLSTLTSPYGPFHACTPHRHSTAITALGQDEAPARTAAPPRGNT
ncbi:DUF4913 domain-containing protein [Amycolatopsis anabasis]|uniref:DUF4913 domain-containing protein n=1 Tax=Amycolatopsis anabasis TaxID=1840409 RepID=UPI001FE26135|nr:DUF4913 domain-containing protein [Amycolatopsis anabasis]